MTRKIVASCASPSDHPLHRLFVMPLSPVPKKIPSQANAPWNPQDEFPRVALSNLHRIISEATPGMALAARNAIDVTEPDAWSMQVP